MNLAQIQALFQANVLAETPDSVFLARLNPPTRGKNIEERFAVYHDGFRLRMAEFLSHDYPVLREALGDEVFGAIVETYIEARPSRHRNARWFGAGLPEFLSQTPPFAGDGFICGLAALEEALARSFDAADAATLPVDRLGAAPPEDWPRLCFGFHPTVVLVDAPVAALRCYEAAQAEIADFNPAAFGDAQGVILVWRDGLEVRYRLLAELEAMALREAFGGKPFGDICAALAFSRPGEGEADLAAMAAQFLANWFSDGLIVAAAAHRE
ncbi:DNA-binding domain-containing protein [uncultured Rhodoblastus sp.]|uniref:DNA-binding domain-containing protein n=1 Tax=uncultured Rhodoblastus sp. TaxID=543037 RepID=UPI0025F40AD6|nr:DNA-binding domain-containing protein [uncultured Rhodoblastus sp.]